ncbi:hypothetical protein [Nocardia nova]|uniref:hypothetical protein n=1 Tax=Nocardia nova TaxID=37330 RepID=UPI003F75F4C5
MQGNTIGGPGPFGIGAEGEHFAAGILDRLPALLTVGCPAVASYLRLQPSHWAGVFRCWGLENREAALRYITGSEGERDRAANIEIKTFDAAANPYRRRGIPDARRPAGSIRNPRCHRQTR